MDLLHGISRMIWQDYLSLLSWQGCTISLQDFINLKDQNIQNPENFVSVVSLLETKEYLTHNKHWWKKAEADYKHCKNKNYKLFYPGKKAYPEKFLQFFDTVPILLSLGDFSLEKT